MEQPPHPMVEGLEERDYYHGKVSGATDEQRAAVDDAERAAATRHTEDTVEEVH
jgi:NADH-quinone oxidoreductase subunit I